MRMIIEARIENDGSESMSIPLAEFERVDGELKQLGLNLADGRSLMQEAQRAMVNAQTRIVVVRRHWGFVLKWL